MEHVSSRVSSTPLLNVSHSETRVWSRTPRSSNYWELWEKLKVNSRFSEFHAKFWGKSMVDEEREWLNSKIQSPDHSVTDDDMIMDLYGYDEDTDDIYGP
jgi:hypothetical protein